MRGEGVLKSESGEEGNSFSVSWRCMSLLLMHSACVGNRQKEWSRMFSVQFVSFPCEQSFVTFSLLLNMQLCSPCSVKISLSRSRDVHPHYFRVYTDGDREHARGDSENNGIVHNEYNHHHRRESYVEPPEIIANIARLMGFLAAADKNVAGEGELAPGWPSPPLQHFKQQVIRLRSQVIKGNLDQKGQLFATYIRRGRQTSPVGNLWSRDFLPRPRDVELPMEQRLSPSTSGLRAT